MFYSNDEDKDRIYNIECYARFNEFLDKAYVVSVTLSLNDVTRGLILKDVIEHYTYGCSQTESTRTYEIQFAYEDSAYKLCYKLIDIFKNYKTYFDYRVNKSKEKIEGTYDTIKVGVYEPDNYVKQYFDYRNTRVEPEFKVYKWDGDVEMPKLKEKYMRNILGIWDSEDERKDKAHILTPKIKGIYANKEKGTIVVKWETGETTKVTCHKDDTWDLEKGVMACITKYVLGNNYNAGTVLNKYIKSVKER